MKQNKFPQGWDEERVNRVLAHYENQTEEQALAEDEAALATKIHKGTRRKRRKTLKELS